MRRAAKPRVFIEELQYIENSPGIFEEFKKDSMPFFLDSALYMEKYGRYSIIGSNPRVIVRSKNGITEIVERGIKSTHSGNPLRVITDVIGKFGVLKDDENEDSLPFTGGAVGYFAYDLNRQIERIPSIAIDDQRLPDIYLGFYDEAVVIDHEERRAYAVFFASHDTAASARKAVRRIKKLTEKIKQSNKMRTGSIASSIISRSDRNRIAAGLESNFTREAYKQTILRAKEYISRGDIFQVNLAQRYSFNIMDDHFLLYCRLRQSNPAPFAAYICYDGFSILSSSPERFMHVGRQYIETRPIKGTRPRFTDKNLDDRSKKELLGSTKDAAEHIMIVDVERNDLGKVCEFGSVQVPDLMVLESYEAVHHLVSTVSGKLRDGIGAMDLIKASFPGGSITGAPKIRAMEIIEELEPHRRNIYCGSIGYISTNGNIDTNIAIRTVTAIGDKGYMQVGGGIVSDSNPDDEYEETLHKGRAIFDSLLGGKRRSGVR